MQICIWIRGTLTAECTFLVTLTHPKLWMLLCLCWGSWQWIVIIKCEWPSGPGNQPNLILISAMHDRNPESKSSARVRGSLIWFYDVVKMIQVRVQGRLADAFKSLNPVAITTLGFVCSHGRGDPWQPFPGCGGGATGEHTCSALSQVYLCNLIKRTGTSEYFLSFFFCLDCLEY